MKDKKRIISIIFILFTIIIWGTTYLATQELLVSFTPVEILIYRFVLALAILYLIKPKILKWQGWKFELFCVIASLCGITVYQYLENVALIYTSASNVSIIISCAAFFTAIFSKLFLKNEEITIFFYIGFVISIIGITLLTFNGAINLELNPLGDCIALFCAILWGVYSVAVKKTEDKKCDCLLVTRRIMLYGVILLIPLFFISGETLHLDKLSDVNNLLWIGYLGVLASALCFYTWNYAVENLGSVKTSLSTYAFPIVTLVVGVLWFNETLTLMGGIGMILTLLGLYFSNKKIVKKELKNIDDKNNEK